MKIPIPKNAGEFKEIVGKDQFTVVFTKSNGQERVLHGTMYPNEEGELLSPPSDLEYSKETIRVFDMDISQWRSFKLSTVKKLDKGKDLKRMIDDL